VAGGALKAGFGSADFVGDLTVFNVGGSKYRLIAFVHYLQTDSQPGARGQSICELTAPTNREPTTRIFSKNGVQLSPRFCTLNNSGRGISVVVVMKVGTSKDHAVPHTPGAVNEYKTLAEASCDTPRSPTTPSPSLLMPLI
jgi:hypothetical protein